ncbi:MAG: hypothetical protein ABEJ89_09135 [Haloarculaceae archaeon]
MRLLVERYRGRVGVTDADGIELRLRRAEDRTGDAFDVSGPRARGVSVRGLLLAAGAALAAGAVMAAAMERIADVIPVIGALYGVANPVVGLVTHEFHSVVFGLVYAGLIAGLPRSRTRHLREYLAVAVAWALTLWLVAAGVVMPVWLRLVGLAAPIPNLGLAPLVGHLVWALVIGGLYYAGERALSGRSAD